MHHTQIYEQWRLDVQPLWESVCVYTEGLAVESTMMDAVSALD